MGLRCLAGVEQYCEDLPHAPVPGGGGGLGQMAVQILEAIIGSTVVAVDAKGAALDVAIARGADHALLSGAGTADEIRSLTGGRGADVVIDCVGADVTLAMGAAAVRQLGDLTIVGIGGGTLPLSFFSIPYEVSVQTTYWGARHELVEVLSLGARGRIVSEVLALARLRIEIENTARSQARRNCFRARDSCG